MMKIIILVRKIVKVPILLLIYLMSRYQRFTLHSQLLVPGKLNFLLDRYEKETTLFFKKNLKKGMVVVDVGANMGYYTRIFSKLVGKNGKVYAFEPDAETYQLLIKNTSHLLNVIAVPYAVSDTQGEVSFYHVPKATSTHSMVPIVGAMESKVKTVILDNFITEKIDAIKIDVEGVEDKVLAGMKRQLENSPWVVFEYTFGQTEELAESLKKFGDLYSITPEGELRSFAQSYFYSVGRGGNQYANVVYRPWKVDQIIKDNVK